MRTEIRQAFWLSLALSLLLSGVASAAGLLIADGGLGGVLEIEEHTVRVTCNNGIVVTEVQQVFRNTEARQVEALYTFPVPEGASVADFTMWIGGREMVGEVVGRQRARTIYDSYKPQRVDPGLLEQTDFKTFEMRIFPIGPLAEQRVRIVYFQELDFDNGWATYVYPLRTVSQEIDSRVHGRFTLSLEIVSAAPITTVKSPSHREQFTVVRHSDNYYQASLASFGADLDRDIVVAVQSQRPTTGLDLLLTRQQDEDGYFQLTFTAGSELEHMVPAMDYVFILDASGSMGEDDRLGLSRASVGAFLDSLGDRDRFEVMSFNQVPQEAFGALRDADPAARDEAREFLLSRRARRSSLALELAVEQAYRYKDADRPLNIVLLTDEMVQREELIRLSRLIRRRPGGTLVFCIGVGNEVNRRYLKLISDEAGGLAEFISHGDDFERQARAFRRKLVRPVITDLEIDVEGIGAYDVVPADLPNLFHGTPVRIYGRYQEAGTGRIRVQAKVGGERLDEWVELEFAAVEEANPEIERMWAWNRVEALQRQAEREEQWSIVNEIVRLGEAYSIVTEYTAFLVLENDEEFRRWKIERRNVLRLGRDHEAQSRVREHLEKLRRKSSLAASAPTFGGAQSERIQVASWFESSTDAGPTSRSLPPSPPRRPVFDGATGGGMPDMDSRGLLVILVLAGLALAAYFQRG